MSCHLTRFLLPLTAMVLLMLAGCGNARQEAASDPAEVSGGPPAVPAGADHDHPPEGPHHGGLIELGNEEYHAELLHDETAGTISIYILDGRAKKAVPIDVPDVTINLKHEGKPEQFKLAARPDEGDPQGTSSRFVSDEAELAEHLDEEGSEARLVARIAGKSYSGDVAHDHDHGHDHTDE